jgi:hypothetical protein
MKKNLFQDNYDHVTASEHVEVKISNAKQQLWTDKRTGAQYSVTSRPANPADADFSDASNLAEHRYRNIMGLPEKTFHERPIDDPFEHDRLPVESMPNYREIEEKSRARAFNDTRKMEAIRPTTEPAESDIVDHGEYTVNSKGQIKDKPKNTVGPFGTEDIRPKSKSTKEDSVSVKRPMANDRAQKLGAPNRPDALETKIGEHRGLQKSLTNAYRSLFGSQFADHIVQRSGSLNTGKKDSETIAHVIMEAGFMKPWVPSIEGKDRNAKPDALIQAVGQRAIATLLKGPTKSDIPDLPKAEREALTTALGRTILHAMTLAPESEQGREVGELKLKQDVKVSLMNAIKPELLRGLVPSDMLDKNTKNESLKERFNAPGQKALAVPHRRPNTDLDEGHSSRYSETETRQTSANSQFAHNPKTKKKLFEFI